jgi:16S rRNA (cytosine1402-N4)-methyltransferase
MHIPVMPEEAMEMLAIRPEGSYLDATCGLGGHTGMIASRLTTGLVISADRDAESLEMARSNTAEWADRIRFRQGSFRELAETAALEGAPKLDGLLADLGVSRYQLTTPERGFSFAAEGPLDMRMDRTQGATAADLVNRINEKALAGLIEQFGEERGTRTRKIARAIVRARPIRSTRHLADVVERVAPRTGKLHPATKTFQALRLAVNDEQGELDALLEIGPELLKSGGRMVVISFMSLSDRKVKEKFRELAREGRTVLLTKHPLQPGEAEIARNPASRSAKLRALEKI